jgi:hypothetical protein
MMVDRQPPERAQQTVVGLPAEIDIANSRGIRDKLAAAALVRGHHGDRGHDPHHIL